MMTWKWPYQQFNSLALSLMKTVELTSRLHSVAPKGKGIMPHICPHPKLHEIIHYLYIEYSEEMVLNKTTTLDGLRYKKISTCYFEEISDNT